LSTAPEVARAALESARVVAVLGASDKAWRAGCYVPEYLNSVGYKLIPINPRLTGSKLWGQPVLATLADIQEPVDIVDIFRDSASLPGHLDELLAMSPLPTLVWLQLGVDHPDFTAAVARAGIPMVADRCTLADHRAFGLGPVQW
jgi:uncharacterized protein